MRKGETAELDRSEVKGQIIEETAMSNFRVTGVSQETRTYAVKSAPRSSFRDWQRSKNWRPMSSKTKARNVISLILADGISKPSGRSH